MKLDLSKSTGMKWRHYKLLGIHKRNLVYFSDRIQPALYYSRRSNRIFVGLQNPFTYTTSPTTGEKILLEPCVHLECFKPNKQKKRISTVGQQTVCLNLTMKESNVQFWRETPSKVYWFYFELNSHLMQVYVWHSSKFVFVCKQSGMKADCFETVWCNGKVHDVFLRNDLEADESGYRVHKFMRSAVTRD